MAGKQKRIFIGWVDICGQIGDYQKGYRKNGHKVFTMVLYNTLAGADYKYTWLVYPDWLYNSKSPVILFLRKFYTALILPVLKFFFFLFAVFFFDVFHFVWVPEKYNELLFRYIKFFKKKIIVHFVGSDIRWVPLWLQEFEMRGLNHPDADIRMDETVKTKLTVGDKLRYVRVFEKYADMIISLPEQGQLQLRPYFNFYLAVDTDEISFKPRNNQIPLVCIGTTGFKDKGSQKLLDDFYKFYETSPVKFELKVIKGMKHKEVIDLLERCDIFIYTPYDCGTGKFGMESLAAGAVTLTGYDKDWLLYPPDSPVVHVQEKTLIEKLLYYLQNAEERKQLSLQSHQFAMKYADINWITSGILKNLDDENSKPEYYPKFFRDHATFNSKWDAPDSIEVCNQWNRYVEGCNWYKQCVPQGERAGLKF